MPPTVGKGQATRVAFVRPSVCLSVCSSVLYIANSSRTQSPSVPKLGMKVPHLRCDSHASFKDKQYKVRVTDGRGHTVSAEPSGHTVCIQMSRHHLLLPVENMTSPSFVLVGLLN